VHFGETITMMPEALPVLVRANAFTLVNRTSDACVIERGCALINSTRFFPGRRHLEITRGIFESQRLRRFGTANPERQPLAFWEWMIRDSEDARTRENRLSEKNPADLGHTPFSASEPKSPDARQDALASATVVKRGVRPP
jgi:hypothetical protein